MAKFLKQCSFLLLLVGLPYIFLCKPKQKKHIKPFTKNYIKLTR